MIHLPARVHNKKLFQKHFDPCKAKIFFQSLAFESQSLKKNDKSFTSWVNHKVSAFLYAVKNAENTITSKYKLLYLQRQF